MSFLITVLASTQDAIKLPRLLSVQDHISVVGLGHWFLGHGVERDLGGAVAQPLLLLGPVIPTGLNKIQKEIAAHVFKRIP